MIHLDTSFLIRSVIPETSESEAMRAWLRGKKPIAISAIAWAEFRCGSVTEPEAVLVDETFGEPIPFRQSDAERAADIFNNSGRRRGTFVDCMIAAVAIGAGAQLATSNLKDFLPFERSGLELLSLERTQKL